MRQELIKSAVSFLSDPKVQSITDMEKKTHFLESKGLTKEEIAKSFEIAKNTQQNSTFQHIQPPNVPSTTVTTFDFIVKSFTLSSLVYGLYFLTNKYFVFSNNNNSNDESVNTKLNEIESELNSAQHKLDNILNTIQQTDNVVEIKQEIQEKQTTFNQHITKEIQSLRDILLQSNNNNNPVKTENDVIPYQQSIEMTNENKENSHSTASPKLPSWQLAESKQATSV